MSTAPKRDSRISPFLPLDLRVYAETSDHGIWALLLTMNLLEWRLGRGEITQAELAAASGMSDNTLRGKAEAAEALGWVEINRKVKPHIYRKIVPEMSWDEFKMTQKLRNVGDKDSAKIAESSRKDRGIIPQKSRNPNSISKDLKDPRDPAQSPGAPTTGENLDQELRRSGFFALWNELYKASRQVVYTVSNPDYKAYRGLLESGRSWASVEAAMRSFFDPKSWDMRTPGMNITIAYFCKRIDAHTTKTLAMTEQDATEAKALYYPPFDPRNPHYDPATPKRNEQFKKDWEAQHGPYKPLPDWTPDTKAKP